MICKKDINKLKKELKIDWEKNLKKKGGSFPRDSQRLNGILCLYENLNKPLSQDKILLCYKSVFGY